MKKLKINAFVVASFLLMINALILVFYTYNENIEFDSIEEEKEEIVSSQNEDLQKKY